MGAGSTSIFDLFLCLFLLASFCHPFFPKFRLFLLQWVSMKFSRVLFRTFCQSNQMRSRYLACFNLESKDEACSELRPCQLVVFCKAIFIFLPVTYLCMRTMTEKSKQTKRVCKEPSTNNFRHTYQRLPVQLNHPLFALIFN